MNSAIQCLLASPFVSSTLISELKTKTRTKELACAYKEIIKGENLREKLIQLKFQVSKHNERFKGNNQEDVAEFLSTLICGIGIDLETKRKYLNVERKEDIKRCWNKMDKEGKGENLNILMQNLDEIVKIEENGSSDFMNLFRAQIYSEIKCKGGCNSEETCFEDRIMMELDLPKGKRNSNLIECFERTFEEVYYGEENENHCDKCDKITIFTRKEWISRLPKIMIIHLKRFETNAYGEQQKNNKSIEFPIEELDVSSLVHDYFKESNPSFKYHLHGVSIHRGTLHGGHYTAHIKNMSGDMKWYECDDKNIQEIRKPLTSSKNPYALFYHRNDIVSKYENV